MSNLKEITLFYIRSTKIIYDSAKVASFHSLIYITSPTFQILEKDEIFMKLCRNESWYCNHRNIYYDFIIAGQVRVNDFFFFRVNENRYIILMLLNGTIKLLYNLFCIRYHMLEQ